MKLKIRDSKTGGDLLLFKEEDGFDRLYFSRDRVNKYFTIVPGFTLDAHNEQEIIDGFANAKNGHVVILTVHGVPDLKCNLCMPGSVPGKWYGLKC